MQRSKQILLATVSCGALLAALAIVSPPAQAGTYTASDETSFRNAITSANADPDPNATITLTSNVTISSATAFPAFTKPVTVDAGAFTLQGVDIASGATNGGSLTFAGGSLLTSGTIRGGNADQNIAGGVRGIGGTGTVLSSGSLNNAGSISGGIGAGGFVQADGAAGGAGANLTNSTLVNQGSLTGGHGGVNNANGSTGFGFSSVGGDGGVGLVMSGGSLDNQSQITGGIGGNVLNTGNSTDHFRAGTGGIGAQLSGGSYVNDAAGVIMGGHGGSGGHALNGSPGGGAGGAGLTLGGTGTFINNGQIIGGTAGVDGANSTARGNTGGAGAIVVSSTITNNGLISGGTSDGGRVSGTGTNGQGGTGMQLTGSTATNTGTILGGTGGASNGAVGFGGSGLVIANSTITNSGSIGGGAGGLSNGVSAAGGVGVSGTGGASVIASGIISGGLSGNGTVRGNAISFTNGNNALQLQAGYTITGVVAATATDILALGGSTNSSLDVSQIGPAVQFRGFGVYQKVGSSTWTLTNTTATTTSWQLLGGTLSVSTNTNLGAAAGTLTFDGGILQVTGTGFTSTARAINWGASGGGFDIANPANTFTISQSLTGGGPLSKLGTGKLIFTGTNTYGGGTTISAGTLQLGSGGTAGMLSGDVADNGTLVFNRSDTVTFGGAISGTGAVSQIGGTNSVTILSGANSYAGATTVASGTLIVNGNQAAATGLTTVSSGATLGGTGTIGGSVVIANGAILAPGNVGSTPGTLTIQQNLTLNGGSILNYDFGQANVAGGAFNDLTQVNGNLVLDGTINVTTTPGGSFGPGIYRVISYSGALTDNGLALGTMPTTGVSVQTSVANQVNLVNTTGLTLNYWDGNAGPKNDGVVNGGNGTWQNSAGNDNWTTSTGTPNAAYQDNAFAIFAGTGGAVAVDNGLGQVSASGMQFATDGYHLTGGAIALVGAPTTIRVGDGTAAGASFTATIDNGLSGTSQLVKDDLGTLVLAGTNTYTGGTTVRAGTLRVFSDANLGDSSGGLTLDGGTLQNTAAFATSRAVTLNAGGGTFQTDAALTVSNAVTGAGPLIKSGNATLILAADSTYNAGTTINSGTLQLGNGGTAGSVVGNITDNGNLAFNRSDNFILTGVVSGTGSLQQAGSGTTILAADNTYTGGTTVSAGTLQLGNGGTTGSVVGDVVDNGALTFSRLDTYTFGGAISGTGSVQQIGAGTTLLTGNSSYSGGTTISAGILQLGNGGTSGSVTGDVLDNTSLVFNRSDTMSLNGVISGSGSVLQAGSGTTILAGNNSYGGATTVAAGALIVNGDQSAATGAATVQNGSTIGGNGTIGGIVTIADGATLAPGNVGSIPGALTIKQDLGLSTGSILAYNFGQAGVAGGAFNDLTRVNGNLVLDGTINVTTTPGASFDPGVYRVISYSGTFTDNGLAIGTIPSPNFFVQTSIPGQVNLVNTAGLTLRFWDGATGPKNDSVVNGGNGSWQNSTGNDNWTTIAGDVNAPFTDAAFAVFSGVPGAVTVDNSLGQVTASGMQFTTDGYHLVGGSIALAGGSSIIRVGDGTVDGAGYTATIDNVLTGNSALVKTDLGTLVLTASNTYTGGTVVQGGVLRIASDANLGDAAGGLTLNGGTLENTASFTTQRAVTLGSNGGTFQTDADLTVSTPVTGNGSLTKTGATALILTGNDTYSGGTTIAAGTLQLGNGGTVGAIGGNIVNNATLVFNRSDTLSFSGNISGTGAVNQVGSGTSILSGNNSYSGATTVAAGTLQAGSAGAFSPASAFAVQSHATLDLHGFNQTVASLANAGTVTTGGAPGTALTLAGDYSASNGLLNISTTLGGDGSPTDRLVVQGNTAGTTSLHVGKVGGTGAQTTEGIKVVHVGGASNGSFVLQGDYAIQGQQAIVAGAYGYTLQKNGISTPNDGDWYLRSSLIDGSSATVPPPPSPPTQPLYQPGVPLYEAYGQLLLDLNQLPTLQERVGYRYLSDEVADSGTDVTRVWVRMDGKHSAFTPRYATAAMDFNANQMQLQAGADTPVLQNDAGRLIAGATARYGHAWTGVHSLFGDGSINTDVYGVSGTLTWYGVNGLYADAQMQGSWFDSRLYSGLASRQMAHNITSGYSFGAESGYKFTIAPDWTLTPQGQLIYSAADFSFPDAFGAAVKLNSGNGLTGRLGMQADYKTKWDDGEGHASEARLYGIANLYHSFLGNTQVDVSGTLLTTKGEIYTGGLGGGGTYNWDDGRYGIYGEILLTSGLGDFGKSYSVGGTGGFRLKF